MLLLLACAGPGGSNPESGTAPVDDSVEAWLYEGVEVPDESAIGGLVSLEQTASMYGQDPSFAVTATFWTGPLGIVEHWDDPVEGVGDCGSWSEPPTWESDPTLIDVGTLFFDDGSGEPYAIAPVAGTYWGYPTDDGWGPPAWGAVFAVTAVGDDLPGFDWDPGLALPAAALEITSPPPPAMGTEVPPPSGDLDLVWTGQDPYATVVIELSTGDAGLRCAVPDTGAHTVPAALLDSIDDGGRMTLTVTRARTRYEPLGEGRHARLLTSSLDRLTFVPE